MCIDLCIDFLIVSETGYPLHGWRGIFWCSSVLTLHDGYVHGPPARPRHAAEARPVRDGWTASAGHQAGPAGTNTESERRASITAQRDSDKSS